MENNFVMHSIGEVQSNNGVFAIQLKKEFIPALRGLDGFSHIQLLWWGHLYDTPEYKSHLVAQKPYKKGPEKMGVFATRSPVRPNPVLLTTIFAQQIDFEKGIIYTPYIDAENGTPVLDIKPYHLSERVKECSVPAWCQHWPKWDEETETFDWQNEFNF